MGVQPGQRLGARSSQLVSSRERGAKDTLEGVFTIRLHTARRIPVRTLHAKRRNKRRRVDRRRKPSAEVEVTETMKELSSSWCAHQ